MACSSTGRAGGIDDPTSNPIHFGQRWYDPATGRFTQPDATGQDAHYTYAANNPVTYTDVLGECSPPNCRPVTEDARAAAAACAAGAGVRAGLGELLKRPFRIFRYNLGALVVSCVAGVVGVVLRERPLISTTPSS